MFSGNKKNAQQQQQQQQPPPPPPSSLTSPSDPLAREKLALYVYEYLCHVGAKEAAQTFLNEMHWHKQITVGEPPGFLHSWWSVFWDLYCAAPERREAQEHSQEAKAFHDYGFVNSGIPSNGIPNPAASPLNMPPHNQGPPDGQSPGHPGFFSGAMHNSHIRPSTPQPSVSQQSPIMGQMTGQPAPFMNQRFPGSGVSPRPMVRMDPSFSSAPNGQPMFAADAAAMMNLRHQLPPGMMQRLPPGVQLRMPQMNQNFPAGMRLNGNMNIPQSMSPMNRPWQPGMPFPQDVPTSSPFHGQQMPLVGMSQGPGTPLRSPQNMSGMDGNPDGMYMIKASTPGSVGQGFGMNSEASTSLAVSDILMNGDGMDMRNSPSGSSHGMGPGTPGRGSVPPSNTGDGGSMTDFGGVLHMFPRGDGEADCAAMMRIKESIAAEAKQFEKSDTPLGRVSSAGSDHGSGEFFSM